MGLTPAELEAVRAEDERLRRDGPTRDPKLSGCLVAFIGMVVLTLTPAVGGWLDIPPGLALGILGGAVLLLAGGAAIGLVGGNRQEREAARARRDSLEVLTRWAEGGASPEEGVRAAVRFLHAGGGLRLEGASGIPPEARALIGRVARAHRVD
jgi:hypothetical protein